MGDETHTSQDETERHRDRRRDDHDGVGMCCVYWCREAVAVVVRLGERKHGCCRKHAAFIQAGKMDWFER